MTGGSTPTVVEGGDGVGGGGGGGAPSDPLPSTLQMLNFEVALRRKEPNARDVLRKVAATESVSTPQLRLLSEIAFECRNHELGVLALELTLERQLAADPRHDTEIASVLRALVRKSESRHAALPHFKRLMRLLESYSDANCPLDVDQLQWFLADAWNKGTHAFREKQYEESEGWMAMAFSVSNYSSALAPWRGELNEGYQLVLKQLNAPAARGARGATDFKARMGKRIAEADDEMRRKRQMCRA
jgi:hypothetical protein